MKHYVVYSHGFGVDRTDRGLLTDISATMPEYKHILFDYNEIDKDSNTLTVNRLQEQVRRLKEQLEKLNDGEEKIVDIVAHSQGCVVAALANPENVRMLICLTPPDDTIVERLINRFRNIPGSTIDLEGISRIVRSDGSITIVPKAYWDSVKGLKVIRLYNRVAERTIVKFIMADDDDVIGMPNFDATNEETIELLQAAGDHNFTGPSRQEICKKVRELLED